MKATLKVWKIGNGLVVTLPKNIADDMDLKVGSLLEVDFKRAKE